MTAYSWSTITVSQGLQFVAADTLTFDTGGTAANVAVAIGTATTVLSYAGKAISFTNTQLQGDKADFLFTDGSNLVVNASGANPGVQVLSVLNDYYYSENDTSTAGVDIVSGGGGDDYFLLGDQNDQATGDGGNDTMNGNMGADALVGAAGNDSLAGGQGDDLVGVAGAGEAGNDSFNGNIGNDTVVGVNDSLFGAVGDDTLVGEAGNDSLSGDAGADSVANGAGNDTAVGGDGNDQMGVLGDVGTAFGDDSYSGLAGNDTVYGGSGADTIFGGFETASSSTEQNDLLNGGAGADSINGQQGNDSVFGGAGNDAIYGGQGGDTLWGGSENDFMSGDLGQDSIRGDAGLDTLIGGSGNDTFGASVGDWGGAGSASTGQTNFETILDFTPGQDKLGFGVAAYRELTGAATFDAALAAANAAPTGVFTAVTVGADTYIFVDNAGGAGQDEVIKLVGVTIDQISAGDLV